MILFACSREGTLASLLSNEPITPMKGEFHENLVDLVFRSAPGPHPSHGFSAARLYDPLDGQDRSHQLVRFTPKIMFRYAALPKVLDQLLAPEGQSVADAHGQAREFCFRHSLPQGFSVSEARTVTVRCV